MSAACTDWLRYSVPLAHTLLNSLLLLNLLELYVTLIQGGIANLSERF